MYRTKPPCGRLKADVLTELPEKLESVVRVGLQGEQRKLATDLIQLNQSKQGAKVYQMFG